MTIAMSMLVHGDAVRFNRGEGRGDDFDFKYLRGRDGGAFPYVSSQCYKKYWRESLAGPFSPIIREEDASGKQKNQAFTEGNPIKYVDDDLFGYMVAGATEEDSEIDDLDGEASSLFEARNIKDAETLKKDLLSGSKLSLYLLEGSPDLRNVLNTSTSSEAETHAAILELLNRAAADVKLAERNEEAFKASRGTGPALKKVKKAVQEEELRLLNRDLLIKAFPKGLQEKPKRPTTRRTAPVRMHALVAFSGIKTAKDFQTFSRDTAYTGQHSVINPSSPGIYSGWLRTRILVESHRIGKFYVGENLDILPEQAKGLDIKKERNPYSREEASVEYVELERDERTRRLHAVLRGLADIGNKQGPASGALHDGSLRPKAFVAASMKCADSPFDYVWVGHNDDRMPYLDLNLLCASIQDWDDLFAEKRIYIGLPVDAARSSSFTTGASAGAAAASQAPSIKETKELIEAELAKIGFQAVVDTTRKAMIQLAQEAVV